ncbi:MAG: VWA domain-containing protein [Thermoflexus hugenholtzii]|uniref:vWA domain-containing protein n=1 Tax=Thermoflexus TaxID=1495649 RepID=UPI001C7904A4|nr:MULTISPECIES: vWA domain-containing protein [Thermoflexus]QWK09917.1 MAG: VWA domain-containing protein [Thermoflexus hugenholtzii]
MGRPSGFRALLSIIRADGPVALADGADDGATPAGGLFGLETAALTRRQFLLWVALASANLAACRLGARPQPTPAPTPTETPTPSPTPRPMGFFEALAALRRAVRASPDHRMARAEALVAAKDPEAIARFVRDAFTVYPAAENEMGNVLAGWRWGVRATLRGGAGTPREIAELLAWLLQQAGFPAEVVEAPQGGRQVVADLLRRAPPAPFAPDLDPATLEAARRVLNLPSPQPPQALDAEGRASAELATPLLAALGEGARATVPFFGTDARLYDLPTVRLTLNGQPQLVNLWAREGPIFTPPDRELKPAEPHRPPLSVTVRLEAARSHAPAERFLLVEKTWSAEDLVGRQVEIAFAPAGARTLEEVLASEPGQRVFFAPVLAVRGPDVDAATTQALSAVGDPFAVTGQVLREEAGRVTLDGQPLPPPDPPGDAPLIASLDLTVNAAAFPLITLELTPRDAQGHVIENLSAAHFLVEEDGRPMPAVMERWTQPAPRVLLLLDDSGSIPEDFRAEGAQALAQDLAARLKAADPRAQFRIAKIDEERAGVGDNDWTDDPAALPPQVQNISGYGSRLWEALADAARHGPTVIVMVTDGQATDANDQVIREPPPGALAAVQAGPPAVVIGVGEVDAAMLERLGQAGRLGAFTATTRDEAVQAVLAALRDNPPPPYRLSYRAPEGGNAPRTVRVFERYGTTRPPSKALLAEARYTPPPPAQRAAGAALSGLFLTVQVGNQAVTRTLGGLFTERNDESPTAEHIADVRRALQGRATLTFEAGSLSLAHLLDDCYTALLSLQPVFEARTRAERLAALASNPIYLPPLDLHVASIPLPDHADEPLTFETGLRVALHRVLPGQTADGQPAAVRWLDLLPLAGFRTADVDPARAFRLTAQRAARLALAEALIFSTSTVAVLKGKPLRLARTGWDIEAALRAAGADEATSRRMQELFAPWLQPGCTILWPGDATPAGWVVDAWGSVWGVLGGEGAATAGGGSGFSATTILDGAMLVSDLAAVAGLGGFSFAGGVWLLLASTLYKKLEAATALLAQLPTSPDSPAPDVSGAEGIADPSDVVCGLAQSAAFEAISRIGGAFFGERFERMVSAVSALDGALSMRTGSGLFC